MDKPSYYAIIPADVRYAAISANAKLLYGEITALSNKEGFCWASNRYFADLYAVSIDTVSRWVSELEAMKAIRVEIDKEAGNKRKIWGVSAKMPIGIGKNVTHSINTKSNNRFSKENHFSNPSEITEEKSDSEGEALGTQPKRIKPDSPTVALVSLFNSKCKKELGKAPPDNVKARAVAKHALTRVNMKQASEMVEDWFTLSKPDQDLMQISQCFSDYRINAFV